MSIDRIVKYLGDESDHLLQFSNPKISKDEICLPCPDSVDNYFGPTDRSIAVLRNLQSLMDHGRLGGTGYVSILPVDQAIEHSAGASFTPNPIYFDPENIVRLAIEAGCNGVASTFGVLGSVARKYAHRIPFRQDQSQRADDAAEPV
jgi:class I fructose-bisphosphate aldolase